MQPSGGQIRLTLNNFLDGLGIWAACPKRFAFRLQTASYEISWPHWWRLQTLLHGFPLAFRSGFATSYDHHGHVLFTSLRCCAPVLVQVVECTQAAGL